VTPKSRLREWMKKEIDTIQRKDIKKELYPGKRTLEKNRKEGRGGLPSEGLLNARRTFYRKRGKSKNR